MLKCLPGGEYWQTPADIRVITVNCLGAMGKGIALEARDRYPALNTKYQARCAAMLLRPGDVWEASAPGEGRDRQLFWLAATKGDWRFPSEYAWVDKILTTMSRRLSRNAFPQRVALPALGCGHGGLDWREVSALISRRLEGLDHEIFIFDPPGFAWYNS